MALVRWTPGTELETLRHEMERLFERTFPKMFGDEMEAEREWRPGLDVRETEEAYVVETDLPGMAAEDITVEVEGPYVVVKGERRAEHEETKEGVKRAERAFGKF